MQTINPQIISGKKVLLRLDIDVPIENGQVTEDFRLRAGLPTLKMCLDHASKVIVLGHIGRPGGKIVPELSVEPIRQWLPKDKKLTVLENLRFDPRESFDSAQDKEAMMQFAKELAAMGDIYINEAFASYHPAVSTTILPTLLSHYAGLRFAQEVEKMTQVRDNPKKPFVAIMGGAKVEDKLPVINVLARSADAVLVGGKLIKELSAISLQLSDNVLVGELNEEGTDISKETIKKWEPIIKNAKMIVWNGPVGKFEDPKNDATKQLARMILESGAEIVIGGGDTIAALSQYGLLQEAEKKAFVSTGGGAMLKFLADGTLPTIEALK